MTRCVKAAVLVALCLKSVANAQSPALTKLEVFPPDVNLNTARDRQSLVVQATTTDGITRDVTAEAKIACANETLVKLAKNVVTPAADGTSEINVEFGGQTVKVPVQVKDAAA